MSSQYGCVVVCVNVLACGQPKCKQFWTTVQIDFLVRDWLMMLMMSSHTIYMLLDNNIERVKIFLYWDGTFVLISSNGSAVYNLMDHLVRVPQWNMVLSCSNFRGSFFLTVVCKFYCQYAFGGIYRWGTHTFAVMKFPPSRCNFASALPSGYVCCLVLGRFQNSTGVRIDSQ